MGRRSRRQSGGAAQAASSAAAAAAGERRRFTALTGLAAASQTARPQPPPSPPAPPPPTCRAIQPPAGREWARARGEAESGLPSPHQAQHWCATGRGAFPSQLPALPRPAPSGRRRSRAPRPRPRLLARPCRAWLPVCEALLRCPPQTAAAAKGRWPLAAAAAKAAGRDRGERSMLHAAVRAALVALADGDQEKPAARPPPRGSIQDTYTSHRLELRARAQCG